MKLPCDPAFQRCLALGAAALLLNGACTAASSDTDHGFVTSGEGVTTNFTATDDTGETEDSGEGESEAEAEAEADSGDGDGDGDGDGNDDSMAFCGDGVVEGFEACDCGTDGECTLEELGELGCGDVTHEESGNPYDGGVLECNLACQLVVTGCYVCGDGVKEESEPCDGIEFGDASCGSAGFLGGEIACTNSCELDTSLCTEAAWSDDFETGDLSSADYFFAGNGEWTVAQDQFNSGANSLGSGAVIDGQSVELRLNIDFEQAGTIAFFHKEETDGQDYLMFYIDGTYIDNWAGTNAWTEETYPVEAGTHMMRWVYSKDGFGSAGADRVWIDDIRTDGTPQ